MQRWVLTALHSFGPQEILTYPVGRQCATLCRKGGVSQVCFHRNGIVLHDFCLGKFVREAV